MAQMLGRVTFNINVGDRLRCIADVLLVLPRDGSRIFSRGGGGLIFKNFVDLVIFRSTKLIFRALPEVFSRKFLRRRTAIRSRRGYFWAFSGKFCPKNCVFSVCALLN